MRRFEVIVLGCGPGGERAAIQAARAGRSVAVVEQANVVGGNRVNWGTIPSKTLRESAIFVRNLTRNKVEGIRVEIGEEITVADFMYRERQVVQRELELINESLARYHVEVIEGHGRFADTQTVTVSGPDGDVRETLIGDIIVIATGSRPTHPRDIPFDGELVFDSESILHLPSMPRSMVVLGAGIIGVEYASIFAALGIAVTLVDTRDRLLPYFDREIAGVLARELERSGVTTLHEQRHTAIERVTSPRPRVRCRTDAGAVLEADVLLYCVGRQGNSDDIGLDAIDLTANPYGQLQVNEHYQTAHPHIYAVGDIVGYPALASTSMEQGRRAIRHAFSISGPDLDESELPFAIYSIPEVSYIGLTEETLIERGMDYVCGRGNYDKNPRGQIIGDRSGLLKLLFSVETLELLGAHIIGQGASELIHIAQAFLRARATAVVIAETLYNYPTLSDCYRHAAQVALAEHYRRTGRQAWT